jgi:hypothetical protein
MQTDELSMWTCYIRPADHPDSLIVRRWRVRASGQTDMDSRPAVKCPATAEQFTLLEEWFSHLHWLSRAVGDHLAVKGTWM